MTRTAMTQTVSRDAHPMIAKRVAFTPLRGAPAWAGPPDDPAPSLRNSRILSSRGPHTCASGSLVP